MNAQSNIYATNPPAQKACAICGNVKDASHFTRSSSSADGLSRECRECDKARRDARKAAGARSTIAPITASPRVARPKVEATDFIQPRDLVATWAAIQMLAQDGDLAPNLLFRGPSGCGKTESARDLAKRAGLPFFKIDAPAIVDPEAWFGIRDVVDGDKGPVTRWTPSLFVEAIQQPCVLLLDEINRVSDSVRQIFLSLLDDSREVTNPLNGQTLKRHPLCFVIMTANVGLAFTGTYAMDPSLLTRCLTTTFNYLDAPAETALVVARTGCDPSIASLFVRFAEETRKRAATDEDFPPISTREVLVASKLAGRGLDPTIAAQQAIISGASSDGGENSVHASLEYIWRGIYVAAPRPQVDPSE